MPTVWMAVALTNGSVEIASMSRRSYAMTSVLLTGLLGLAPLVYGLFSRIVNRGGLPETEGVVLLFLVAALCTMTAAFGQIALILLLLDDFAAAQLLGQGTTMALWMLFVALRLLLAVYGVMSIRQTVIDQEHQVEEDNQDRRCDRAARPGATPEAVRSRRPPWSLL